MSKAKVGFNWMASCGGCEEAIIDLDEAILDVLEKIEIVFWPCAMDFKKEDLENMADGEMAVAFVNGAVRTTDEMEMAKLMRKKSGVLIAFGSCAHTGGIPSLGNLSTKESIIKNSFLDGPAVVNPEGTVPLGESTVAEGTLTLPVLQDTAKTLDQVVDVDYYLPGCPPPVRLIVGALDAILSGNLPPKGSVLAPDVAQCEECARSDTKPERLDISEFKRPSLHEIDQEKCLLAQGFLCLGPATRAGCDAPCPAANMPCTGCLGPTSRVVDYGAKAMSSIASLLDENDEEKIETMMDGIVDPEGTFYRYSMGKSFLHQKMFNVAKKGA